VITVYVASTNRTADCWIPDTGASNHLTGNRHLFESFHTVALGEHHIKMVHNSFVDARGSRTITVWFDRANANPAKIILQHVIHVPACGSNNLLSIIQSMPTGVNLYFKLNGHMASLGLVLVYEAPLINSLFVLTTSTT
jgi:hypothetical protein